MAGMIVISPALVQRHSHRKAIHDGVTLTLADTGGAVVFTGIGSRNVTLAINVTGVVSGTNPTLSYSLQEVDPGNQSTVHQQSSTGSITATSTTRIVRLHLKAGDCVRVSWSIGGTSPSFAGVYATLTATDAETEHETYALASGATSWTATLMPNGRPHVVFQAAAGYSSATAELRYSMDNGTTYVAVPVVYDPATGAFVSSTVTFSGSALTRVIAVPPGATHVRAAMVGASSGSGSALMTLRANSNGALWSPQLPLALGQLPAANSLSVVLANDQVPDALARAWFQKITDGSNTTAVKAASTAPVAADPALVVALSPNTAEVVATQTFNNVNLNAQVTLGDMQGALFQLSAGTLAGTLTPQFSIDNVNWVNTTFLNPATGERADTLVLTNPNALTHRYVSVPAGAQYLRVRSTAFTSGSAAGRLQATKLPPWHERAYGERDVVVTGTVASGSGPVSIPCEGKTTVLATITGSFVGTLAAQWSDGVSSYIGSWYPANGNAPVRVSSEAISGGTIQRIIHVPTGAKSVSVNVSAFTSGSSTVVLRASNRSEWSDVNIRSWFDSLLPTVGQKVMASSIPVVLPSNWSIPAGTNNIGDVDIASWVGGSTAPTVGQKNMAASIPVVPASDYSIPDTTASGTLGALNAEVLLSVAGKNSVSIRVNWSTLVGSIQLETQVDGTNWQILNLIDYTTGLIEGVVTNGTGTRVWIAHLPGGINQVRMRCSAYTSGATSTCFLRASTLSMGILPVVPLMADVELNGSFGALNDAMTFTREQLNGKNSIGFRLHQGLSLNATLVAEYLYDLNNWAGTFFINPFTGLRSSSIVCTAGSASFHLVMIPPAARAIRVRCSAYTSGTSSSCALRASSYTGWTEQSIFSWFGSTAPTVGQKTMANSIPMVLPSDQTVATLSKRTPTATVSSAIAASTGSVQLAAANANRIGGYILNDSSSELFIKYGTTASGTSKTGRVAPFDKWELDDGYTGRIDGYWTTATGNAFVTELT